MKKLIPLVFILCSCASTPPPGVQVVTQKVEVPVQVPCNIAIPRTPVYNFDKLSTNDDIFTKIQAIMADRLLQKAYEAQLAAALDACTK
jgi:hypothetical protein